MYESTDICVSHPNHYASEDGIECIDAIRAALGDGFEGYCNGNVLKYIWRYKKKNGVQDLEKAAVYLNWLIQYLKTKDSTEFVKEN